MDATANKPIVDEIIKLIKKNSQSLTSMDLEKIIYECKGMQMFKV